MKVYDQERKFDIEFDIEVEIDERIWKEEAELANKGKLIFKTSAHSTYEYGEQWIELYEKAVLGRNDQNDKESCEFKFGLAMIKEAWCDDKGNFIIKDYMEYSIILYGLEHPYRLQYLINKHIGIQEKVIEPWIEDEYENVDGTEI